MGTAQLAKPSLRILVGSLRGFALGIALVLPIWPAPAASGATSADRFFEIGPRPEWVIPPRPAEEFPASARLAGRSRQFLFVDDQAHIGTTEHFIHRSYELLDPQGLQEGSEFRAVFRPAYERVTVHTVAVIRDGARFERFDASRARVIDLEDEAPDIYHGQAAVVLPITDTRVGDRIEIAYTKRGQNPVFGGRYAGMFRAQWATPVRVQRTRLVVPSGRTLHFKAHGEAPLPKATQEGAFQIYQSENHDIPAAQVPDRVPGWLDPMGWLQVSEFNDWSEVAQWAVALFADNGDLPPEIQTRVQEWAALGREEQRALAILDFAQKEIRYLGESLGESSHAPANPQTVIARRYGDCKDKTRLLCALAGAVGLEARPVLVSTIEEGGVTNWWPSPLAFDHVIARLRVNGAWHLVDPTRSFQEGPLSARYVPDYATGLPVEPNATQLAELPRSRAGAPRTVINEKFTMTELGGSATLTVETVAAGLDADSLRRYFANNTPEEAGEAYTKYYGRLYPGIEADGLPEFSSDPATGQARVREAYRIPEFWKAGEGSRAMNVWLLPTSFDDIGDDARLPDRAWPLTIDHPRHLEARTSVEFPEEWDWESLNTRIEGPASVLDIEEGYSDRTGWRKCVYRATAPVVERSDLARHRAAEKEMSDVIGFELTWDPTAGEWRINWALAALVGLFAPMAMAGIAVAHWRFEGLRGWLLLVGLAVVATPIRVGINLVALKDLFNLAAWHEMTHPSGAYYHPLMGFMIPFSILGTLLLFALSLWQPWLFFTRHRLFPKVYIIFLASSFMVHAIDAALISRIPMLAEENAPGESARNMIRMTVACAIWIPYMLRSVRVKNTFTR
jgi:transglutaminase-like putative cysteine protease